MMAVFRHLLVFVLYSVILIKLLLTSSYDGDDKENDQVTSFDITLRILDEIRGDLCLPCFQYTNHWRGRTMFKQYYKPDNQGICTQIECSFQGRCANSNICYSWTITVISQKQKYVLFSHTNASSDKGTVNVTCYDTGGGTKHLSPRSTKNTIQPTVANTDSVIGKTKNKQKIEALTTGMKELQLKTSTSNNEKTDQEGSGDIDYKDDADNDIDHKNADRRCQRKCNQCRRCSGKQKDCPTSVDAGKQKDCPACVDVGVLFITHVIAAVVGAGILYVIQIIKKYRGKRNGESNRKSNEGMVNVAYGLTRGVNILQTSNVNQQEEAIYNEVDDKPYTVQIDHTSSNCSTGGTSNNRKLPDIPHENEKNKEYLLPQTPKDPLLPDLSDKVKTPISLVPEELSLKDLNESNQGTEHDVNLENCGQETIVTDSGDDYFVLQKTDNMDLK